MNDILTMLIEKHIFVMDEKETLIAPYDRQFQF